MLKDFIEVTSVTGKTWLIRVTEIAYIAKRDEATDDERIKLHITEELSNFTVITLIHINKQLWVRDTYDQVLEKINKLE